MKTLNILLVTTLIIFLGACSSVQKAEKPTAAPEVERDFKIDYVLINASEEERPKWLLSPMLSDDSDKRDNHRYFVSEGSHSQKRLCLKSSEARANARIAGEITQFIKNTYSEATQGDEDDVTSYMQEQLTQEIQSFVVGAQTSRTYWEKRRYEKERGATRNQVKYACFALVRMKKENLNKMIQMARKKILRSIDEPEVKKKTEKAIRDVEKKFMALEKPVTSQNG
jgi:hypothetical protein